MKLFLVPGIRLDRSGRMTTNFRLAMERAIQLMRQSDGEALLVVSGGVTRPGFPSEADAAMERFPEDLRAVCLLEKKAETTRQNVRFVKDLLNGRCFDSICLVGTKGHMKRAAHLFKEQWPEAIPNLSMELVGEHSIRSHISNEFLHILMTLDPGEKFFLPARRLFIRSGIR